MEEATCFRCGNKYGSHNPDDIAGDGRCPPCTELALRAVKKVEAEMRNRTTTKQKSRIRELFSEEEILHGEIKGTRRINIRDLGIDPNN